MAPEASPRAESGRQSLSGIIVSRFDDGSRSAFQSGRIETEDRDVVFVAEHMPQLRTGIVVRVSGYWERHADHGRQMRIIDVQSACLPRTAAAVERLLVDVQGFGPALAKKVVTLRGPGLLNELVMDPSLLTRLVPGKRGLTLQMGWERWLREWKDGKQAVDFAGTLVGLGCTPFEARRVIAFFRSPTNARLILLRHPYRLLDVPGFSWEKVERIAAKLGVVGDDPERLVAAALGAANRLLDHGDSAASREVLEETTARLTGQPKTAPKALHLAIKAGDLVDDGLLYLPRALEAEWSVASQIRRLARRARTLDEAQEDHLRTHLANTLLNPEQRQAVENACRLGVSVLTGGPGTGKTTTTKEIVRAALMMGDTVSIIAPTGRAAMRSSEVTGAPASTIHKAIGGPPGSRRDVPISDGLVVVEECSMVSVETMAWLLENISTRTRLVLVGDADQLPSVEHGAVLRDILEAGTVPVVNLRSVYRQGEESGIIVAARRVIQGERLTGREGAGFYWNDTTDHDEAHVTQRTLDAVRWLHSTHPASEIQVLTPMKRGSLGTAKLNLALQSLLNRDGAPGPKIGDDSTVRVGDRVIQVRNDYSMGDSGIMNGQQGRVVDADGRRIRVVFDNESLWVGDYRLYNLRLAWAVTIHKSQGSEWPHVVVVAHPSHGQLLNRQLLYTALTRARHTAVLIANEEALVLAYRRDTGRSRCTGLTHHLRPLHE